MRLLEHLTTHNWVGEHPQIVLVELGVGAIIDISMAQKIVTDWLQLTEHKPHYLLLDITQLRGFTTHAKQYLQRPDEDLRNILGAALITSNPLSLLLANIFIKSPKAFAAKFFINKSDALRWISKDWLDKSKSSHF